VARPEHTHAAPGRRVPRRHTRGARARHSDARGSKATRRSDAPKWDLHGCRQQVLRQRLEVERLGAAAPQVGAKDALHDGDDDSPAGALHGGVRAYSVCAWHTHVGAWQPRGGARHRAQGRTCWRRPGGTPGPRSRRRALTSCGWPARVGGNAAARAVLGAGRRRACQHHAPVPLAHTRSCTSQTRRSRGGWWLTPWRPCLLAGSLPPAQSQGAPACQRRAPPSPACTQQWHVAFDVCGSQLRPLSMASSAPPTHNTAWHEHLKAAPARCRLAPSAACMSWARCMQGLQPATHTLSRLPGWGSPWKNPISSSCTRNASWPTPTSARIWCGQCAWRQVRWGAAPTPAQTQRACVHVCTCAPRTHLLGRQRCELHARHPLHRQHAPVRVDGGDSAARGGRGGRQHMVAATMQACLAQLPLFVHTPGTTHPTQTHTHTQPHTRTVWSAASGAVG
jgi:hypothetical protein